VRSYKQCKVFSSQLLSESLLNCLFEDLKLNHENLDFLLNPSKFFISSKGVVFSIDYTLPGKELVIKFIEGKMDEAAFMAICGQNAAICGWLYENGADPGETIIIQFD